MPSSQADQSRQSLLCPSSVVFRKVVTVPPVSFRVAHHKTWDLGKHQVMAQQGAAVPQRCGACAAGGTKHLWRHSAVGSQSLPGVLWVWERAPAPLGLRGPALPIGVLRRAAAHQSLTVPSPPPLGCWVGKAAGSHWALLPGASRGTLSVQMCICNWSDNTETSNGITCDAISVKCAGGFVPC